MTTAGSVVAAGVMAAGVWATTAGVVALPPAPQNPSTVQTYRPPPPPAQPIAYSHKQHLARGLVCATCHATATTASHAALPPTATCMGCHVTVKTDSAEIQRLKEFDLKKEEVPWARVYRLPDYVYFSHMVHLSKNPSITCETCHGNVREMEATQKVTDISMAACVQCHKQHAATIRCDACHEPRG